jgi:hypothetical protein
MKAACLRQKASNRTHILVKTYFRRATLYPAELRVRHESFYREMAGAATPQMRHCRSLCGGLSPRAHGIIWDFCPNCRGKGYCAGSPPSFPAASGQTRFSMDYLDFWGVNPAAPPSSDHIASKTEQDRANSGL